jgi:hypothetical protein
MHFHLPKPLHGWREFAGEVGIIVVGVLIALGAEQLLQSWHWGRETEATRQALREEAGDNLHAAALRMELSPCIDRRLQEIGAIFADHAAHRPIRLARPIGRPVSYYGSTDTWQVEVASQALSHMPLDEKIRFSTAFSNFQNLNSVLRIEQDSWLRLDVLDAPDQLQDGDWPPLRQAYAQANSLNARLQIIAADVLHSYSLGQKPHELGTDPPEVTAAIRQFCRPLRAAGSAPPASRAPAA